MFQAFFISRVESFIAHFFTWLREKKTLRQLTRSYSSIEGIGKQELVRLLPENCTIVEVGCHVGIDTLQFSLLFPKGRVFAFEPSVPLLTEAFMRTRNRNNVQLFPIALSSTTRLSSFYLSSGSSTGSSSLLKPTQHLMHHPKVFFRAEDIQLVCTTTLDDFVVMKSIESIDLIWLDVQGAELDVLKGSSATLRKTKYIYTEVSRIPLYENGVSYEDLSNFLLRNGFAIQEEFLPPDWAGEGNVLFVNTERLG